MDCELGYNIDILPNTNKNIRACLLCGPVETVYLFLINGCDNCENYFVLKEDKKYVCSCTSANHDRLVFTLYLLDSFICKYYSFEKHYLGSTHYQFVEHY